MMIGISTRGRGMLWLLSLSILLPSRSYASIVKGSCFQFIVPRVGPVATTDLTGLRLRNGPRLRPLSAAVAPQVRSSSTTSISSSKTSAFSPPVFIPDSFPGYKLSDFAIPKPLIDSGELESIFLPSGIILDRIDKMAEDLLQATMASSPGPKTLHLLCVLKGSSRFFQILLDALRKRIQATDANLRISIDFIKVSSYSNMESTGKVKISGIDPSTLKGKNVVVVEDMIDTGTTMRKLVPYLEDLDPASLRVISMLKKRLPSGPGEPIPHLDSIGFSVPDVFSVGFGLDYNEFYRDLDHLCLLSKKGVEMHKAQ